MSVTEVSSAQTPRMGRWVCSLCILSLIVNLAIQKDTANNDNELLPPGTVRPQGGGSFSRRWTKIFRRN